jgi:hypothetical protein
MNKYLPSDVTGVSPASLQVRFDALRDTPELIESLSVRLPTLRHILANMRAGVVPLMPSSHPGSFGNFVRLPNHYRSVCFKLPGTASEPGVDGVVVLKGTEPLLPDFPQYLDWMLRAPFRGSYLSLGLYFPLEMKLPPGAMWIEECVLEQKISSQVQQRYLAQYGYLARLPVPLFVFELTAEQVESYREVVRARLSADAFSRIDAKVRGGLGVEVYYYPSLPIRVADLPELDVKAFSAVSSAETLKATFDAWIQLMAELLGLGYMPSAPWNRGMGGYVDPGNACIDGGFNDLVTIVPFDSIPSEYLFWRSLRQSIQMLAHSVAAMCVAVTETRAPLPSEPPAAAVEYVTEELRHRIRSEQQNTQDLDPRLTRFFEVPSVTDLLRHLRDIQRPGRAAQYRPPASSISPPSNSKVGAAAPSETHETIGA